MNLHLENKIITNKMKNKVKKISEKISELSDNSTLKMPSFQPLKIVKEDPYECLERVINEKSLSKLADNNMRESYEINAVSNCGMDNEKIYHGLDELEEAQGYLTTVIVKKKNNCISSNNMK